MPQIQVSKQANDADYGIRSYYIETSQGKKGIRHGGGPTWGSGQPLDEDVWKSVTFEEQVFKVDGFRVLASRGEWAGGARWRAIGKLGETATYGNIDQEAAKTLDSFMDGACIADSRSPFQ